MHLLQTFPGNRSVQEEFLLDGLTREYGTDRLSGNVDDYYSKQLIIREERRSFVFYHWTRNLYYPLIFVLWPTNTQLSHKISHTYMFRQYRVILREHV